MVEYSKKLTMLTLCSGHYCSTISILLCLQAGKIEYISQFPVALLPKEEEGAWEEEGLDLNSEEGLTVGITEVTSSGILRGRACEEVKGQPEPVTETPVGEKYLPKALTAG